VSPLSGDFTILYFHQLSCAKGGSSGRSRARRSNANARAGGNPHDHPVNQRKAEHDGAAASSLGQAHMLANLVVQPSEDLFDLPRMGAQLVENR
jgi:hypothetical protein